jgi:hypothetical protein
VKVDTTEEVVERGSVSCKEAAWLFGREVTLGLCPQPPEAKKHNGFRGPRPAGDLISRDTTCSNGVLVYVPTL